MSGLIKRGGEEAAKAVGTGDAFAPVDLGMLGRVVLGPDGRPQAMGNPANRKIQSDVTGLLNQLGLATQNVPGEIGSAASDQLSMGRGMLSDVSGFNPLDLAEERFGRLQGILSRQRDNQRAGLEERLYSQGRLDSTGRGSGAELQSELESGFAREDAMLLDQLLSSAEQSRRDEIGLGSQLLGEGSRLGGGLMAQLTQSAAVPGQLDAGLLQALTASGGIGQAELNQAIARSNAIQGHNQVMASRDGGGLMSTLAPIAGAAVGSFAGPIGTAVGGKVAKNLFGG